MINSKLKMVITDLDGTLLNNSKQVSKMDLETLKKLKNRNIIRVVATGRSLYSSKKVLKDNFPIDYLIFSSGLGLVNWKSKKITSHKVLNNKDIKYISDIFIKNNIDFSIQNSIPDNHHFWYYTSGNKNLDFENRNMIYKKYAKRLVNNKIPNIASQFIGIIPYDLEKFNNIKNQIENYKIIRASSPLDGKSIWIEVFPKKISKASGVKSICKKLKIKRKQTMSIGNDYNDIDLLNWTNFSYIVSNAPSDLKEIYKLTSSNTNSGFSEAVNNYI